jgi:hypothetical protein
LISLVSSISIIYTWIASCALLFFLYAIARFYEQKSGRRSYYPLFLIPIILFAGAAFIYAFPHPNITGNFWADLMRFIGGLMVGGVGLFLLNLMTGDRH